MDKTFSQIWLENACKQIPDVRSAIFVMPDTENDVMRLMAKWPIDLEQHEDLLAIVKYCLKKNEPVCMQNAHIMEQQDFDFFAVPISRQNESPGVIVVCTKQQPEKEHEPILKALQNSTEWLCLSSACKGDDDSFYSDVVGVLAACFEQTSYHEGLLRMVAELTVQFNCERVAFAECRQHHCQVLALSNSADFDQRSNLIKMIADAMDEAIDQDSIILFPDSETKMIQGAHQELIRKYGYGSLCTIPLVDDNQIFGAITLLLNEEKTFDNRSLNICQQTLSLITPFLVLKRDQEKSLLARLGNSLKQQSKRIFGFKYLKLKLATLMLGTLVITANLIEIEYRVPANAIIEGKIQRVIAAPISGYLLSAAVRAGDTVREGDVLANLNDSDLRLEQAKLNGELQKNRSEYREAQSKRDLVRVSVLKEKMNQVNAELDLNSLQLEKIRLTAPFDGIVIEGNLDQLLGSPVERGDNLFKIAPLDGYRIILKVNESQISSIKPGQTGILALSSLSDQRLPLTVEKITAVAKAEDGANIFRVQASLDNASDLLRPGMEGIGKINTGNARLSWIWTHEIRNWLNLWVWSWWP